MPYAPSEHRHDLLWTDLKQRRDDRARQALVLAHVDLVQIVAHRIRASLPRHVDPRDLYGAGLVGLLQAVDQFDPTRGIGFSTFATPRIRGAILDELRAQDWLPRRLRRQAREIDAVHSRLENERGRAVSLADVAEALDTTPEALHATVHEILVRQPVSLDEPPRRGGRTMTPAETLADPQGTSAEDRLAAEQRRHALTAAIDALPTREREVLRLHYFDGMRLREIGLRLRLSESRVSQLHGQALHRLRARLSRGLEAPDFLSLELAAVGDPAGV